MPYSEGTIRVADLFRRRNAQRLGLNVTDADHARDEELDAFGESLGIGRMQVATPAMPGKPMTSGGEAAPAGDVLSALAPPPGSAPTMQTEQMQSRAQPMAPGGGHKPIPSLDAMSETPRKRDRGYRYDRALGRVLKGGAM